VDYEGSITFSDIQYVVQSEELLTHLGPLVPKSLTTDLDLIKRSPIKEWLFSCRYELEKGTELLKSIIRSDSKKLVVEIHTEGFYPSKAAIAEQRSFTRHIIDHVEGDVHQLQEGKGNFIVIQGNNWILFDVMDFLVENPVYREIKQHLIEKGIRELNGIVIIKNDFDRPVFIYNDDCDPSICLNKDQLRELGYPIII
jgi:hypothetical protein